MSVPIAVSPGRSGFGPQLSLSYDSGAGNGPFGLGWHQSLPSVTRKTDKGLPRYQDADESDVFILSGVEDLVPQLKKGTLPGEWAKDAQGNTIRDEVPRDGYLVQRYQPRVEGLFARIERWRNPTESSDTFWRSISRDNVTTVYGKTPNARIFDPADPSRIFSWLICETYDDKGNELQYCYKAEDDTGVERSQANERHRVVGANRYLKHIYYGNRVSRQATPVPDQAKWLFEVVFDYGEHSETDPKPDDLGPWRCRSDAFSSYRAGFEVRTYRLCQRVLMFHHFSEEDIGVNCLVRSTGFSYRDPLDRTAAFIASVTQTGYKRATPGPGYLHKSLPPLEFEYTEAKIDDQIRDIDAGSLENLPIGLDGTGYQWVDLDGEGVSGIFTEQAGAWFYKRNISPISKVKEDGVTRNAARFGSMELVAQKPAVAATGTGGWQFQDLAGNGRPDLARFEGPVAGFFQRTAEDQWDNFVPFRALPNVSWGDPNLRFLDLSGDGLADILITDDHGFTWYPSLGETGFAPSERTVQGMDEESGPRLVFADGEQAIYLADLSGDGLTDLVRIRNGEVCYWPNLGYGRFGAKVTMDNAPWFDAPDQFSQRRIRLADIDGSGLIDIIYLGHGGITVYFNQAGNSWSAGKMIDQVPKVDDLTAVQVVDLFGNGTACLVWSSPLPGDARQPMRYIDLMGGQKPHLLVRTTNNLGAETLVQYAPSTKFYLADKAAGRPWITKLPFPVHVVEKVTVKDKWRNTAFASTSSYHHGYFDGVEREFRGFGRVDQVDVESFGEFATGNADSPYITADKSLYQPPVKTVTWFHTGAALDHRRILNQFQREYFPNWLAELPTPVGIDAFPEKLLPEPDLVAEDLNSHEWREALRACKGMTLRQEVYELDELEKTGKEIPVRVFSTATHNCAIRRLQPQGHNRHAVFLVTESEALNYHYELDLRPPSPLAVLQPDPRIAHTLNLRFDEFGNVEQSIAVGYPRVRQHMDTGLNDQQLGLIREVQGELHIAYSETHYTTDPIDGDAPIPHHRQPKPWEMMTYELTGLTPGQGRYFSLSELREYQLSESFDDQGPKGVGKLEYHERPTVSAPPTISPPQRRKVEHVVTLFLDEDLQAPLGPGNLGRLGLTYETYKLAITKPLLQAVLGSKFDSDTQNALDAPAISGYLQGTKIIGPAAGVDQWWIRSGVAGFASKAKEHFYLPEAYRDPFGNETTVEYDGRYRLFVQSRTDSLQNRIAVYSTGSTARPRFDYRVLAPIEMEDFNGNRTEVCFDVLGMVVAVAVKGKGTEADDLTHYTDALTNPDLAEVLHHFDLPQLTADEARARFSPILGNATTRYLYHFGETVTAGRVAWNDRPAGACAIVRERHVASLAVTDSPSPLQVAFECSDGTGTVLMKRSQAEPDPAGTPVRWIVSGKTVLNNKGKPVKQYEPYFSNTAACCAEGDIHEEFGVTPLMYYDAAGRLVRTEMPDGTLSRVLFSPWHVLKFDANDTVAESRWYQERMPGSAASTEEKRAAQLALVHADTPGTTILDSLGREVIAVAHNKFISGAGATIDEKYLTFTKLDAEGKPLWICDARGNLVMQYLAPPKPDHTLLYDTTNPSYRSAYDVPFNAAPSYDIAGNLLFQHSMDAGDRWMLMDAVGKPMLAWDFNERQEAEAFVGEERLYSTRYDALHRPTEQWLAIATAVAPGPEILADEPIGYWHLGEAAGGATAGDATGHLHEGTYSGGVTLGQQGFHGRETAALFDGATGRVVVPNNPILNPARITMEARIRWDGPTGFQQRILEKESYAGTTQYGLSILPDGRVQVELRMRVPGTPIIMAATSTDAVALAAKTHVAATYDGLAIRIYRNGILDSATTVNAIATDIDTNLQINDPKVDLALGDRIGVLGPSHRTFNGLLGEVALFDRALTGERLAAHYLWRSEPARMVERSEYLDATNLGPFLNLADVLGRNLCGQLYKHYDPSGLATLERMNFQGQPSEITRCLVRDVRVAVVDWNVPSRDALLETEVFRQIIAHDVLGRMTTFYNWHRDDVEGSPGHSTRVAVYVPKYNERGLLLAETLHVQARKESLKGKVSFKPHASPRKNPEAIRKITWNAKGQKIGLELGNGTTTRYSYDPGSFRLTHLYTRRDGHVTDCAGDPASSVPPRPCGVQNLHYTHDAVGNIVHIQDDAQQTIWFRNQQVEPSNDYLYDALYRLIEATGRENVVADAPPRHPEGPWPVGPIPSPNATRLYRQRYQYDSVGNIREMRHLADGGSWTRSYDVELASNRIKRTWYGGDSWDATMSAVRTEYLHDPHGNMLNLARTGPGVDNRWDWRDMLGALDLEGGGWAYYNYGIDKQRTRKLIERNGQGTEDRVYLGGYELCRRRTPQGVIVEEIESLHLLEGEGRVLLVDDVLMAQSTSQPGLSVKQQTLLRYQYGNHIGSVGTELDESAQLISHEEFHPYGTSAYRLMKSGTEAPPRRYRHTGMEKDEESGLSYHHARLFAPLIARWTNTDPHGVEDGVNVYSYVSCNPLGKRDPSGTIGEPEQLHLTEQAGLRQAVTATTSSRGYGSWLQKTFQALGSQWMRGAIDVGDPEDMPFAITAPGTTRLMFAQPRAENRAIGRDIIKPLVQAARAAGVLLRTHGTWPGGIVGQLFGQPPKTQRLLGLSDGTTSGEVLHQTSFNFTWEQPQRTPTTVEQYSFDFAVESQLAARSAMSAVEPSALETTPARIGTTNSARSTAEGESERFAGSAQIVGAVAGLFVPDMVGNAAASLVPENLQEGTRTLVSMVAGTGIDWVGVVGPQAALTSATVLATAAHPAAGAAVASAGAAVTTAFSASLGTIAVGGAGAIGVAAGAVVAAGVVGYAIGTEINKELGNTLIDAVPESVYDLSYRLFFK